VEVAGIEVGVSPFASGAEVGGIEVGGSKATFDVGLGVMGNELFIPGTPQLTKNRIETTKATRANQGLE